MAIRIAALCVAFIAASGCGSSSSTEDKHQSATAQIQAAVEGVNEAGMNADGDLLCRSVLPNASFSEAEVRKCAAGVTKAIKLDPQNWHPISDVTEIKISGDSATAMGTQDGVASPLDFVKQGDDWRMQVFD
ncbi:hypothetical protein BH10ACT11_BH10ACT11_10040 [soil metagenome]